MSDISRSSSTGNAEANAHVDTPIQEDGEPLAVLGDQVFHQEEGTPPPAPIRTAHLNLSNRVGSGLSDGAHAVPTENSDIDDSASDTSSISDTVYYVGLLPLDQPRDPRRTVTFHRNADFNDRDIVPDDGSSTVSDVSSVSDTVYYVGRLPFGQPPDPTRTVTFHRNAPADDQDDISDDDSLVELSDDDSLVELSDDDSLVELPVTRPIPEDTRRFVAHELLNRSHGTSDAATARDFRTYRERDFSNLGDPLPFGEWRQRETGGTDSTFVEVPVPDTAPGEPGYVLDRARVIDRDENAQVQDRKDREAKPGWKPTG